MTGWPHLFIAQVRHTRPVKLVQLTEAEISALCHFCQHIIWGYFWGGRCFWMRGVMSMMSFKKWSPWFLGIICLGKKIGGAGRCFFEKILECDSTVLFRLKVRCFSEKASYWIMVCWEHVDFRFSYGAQLEETTRWISRFEARAPI